jgi:hypothetical protein
MSKITARTIISPGRAKFTDQAVLTFTGSAGALPLVEKSPPAVAVAGSISTHRATTSRSHHVDGGTAGRQRCETECRAVLARNVRGIWFLSIG